MPAAIASTPLRLLRRLARAGDWLHVARLPAAELAELRAASVPLRFSRDRRRVRLRQCDAVAWLLGTPRRVPGKTFGRRVLEARSAADMSLRELGHLVWPTGTGAVGAAASINDYERGKHEPRIGIAHQIGAALGVPVCEMLGDGCRR